MGKNKTKVTGFRFEDQDILKKLDIISKMNCRTRNKEVEYALKTYVQDFEDKNGIIHIESGEEQDKQQEKTKTKTQNNNTINFGTIANIGENNGTINM